MKKLFYSAALALLSTNAMAQCAPIAHWNFNGTTSDVVNGWAPAALPTNPTTYVTGSTGIPGTALHFNGSQFLQYAHSAAMDVTSWTITAMVRPTGFYSGACQNNLILTRGAQWGNSHYAFGYYDHPFDNSCATASPANNVFSGGGPGLPGFPDSDWITAGPGTNPFLIANQWYCAAVTYDGTTGRMRIYVNGTLVTAVKWPNSYAYGPRGNDLFIGSSEVPASAWPYFLDGDLDDVALYGCALTPASIKSLCGSCPDPIMHWNFNNNTHEVINSWGAVTTPSTINYVTGSGGAPNTAIELNGSEFLEYASDPLMDLTSWTITAVVKPDAFNGMTCQNNLILSRGNQGSTEHYALGYYDHPFDNNCSVASPSNNVFSIGAAGAPGFPDNDWISAGPGTNPYLSAGTWYCVTATYDGTTGDMKLYVNGTLVTNVNWPPQYLYPFGSSNNLFIGSSNVPGSGFPYFLNGAIDDIRIYDRVIPPACQDCQALRAEATAVKGASAGLNKAIGLTVKPNPANDMLTISMDKVNDGATYAITNSMGAVVKHGTLSSDNMAVDIHELPSGLYMISAKNNNNIETIKFVVQH